MHWVGNDADMQARIHKLASISFERFPGTAPACGRTTPFPAHRRIPARSGANRYTQ